MTWDWIIVNATTAATTTSVVVYSFDDGNGGNGGNGGSDDSFWTDEQRRLLLSIPRSVYFGLGIYLILLIVFGVTTNGTILYVFSRYFRLL